MHKFISGLFFFGLSLFVIWESLRLKLGTLGEPGSGFISFYAGVILSGLSLVLIYRNCRNWGFKESLRPHSRRVMLAVVCLFIYSLVLNTVGFMVATFLLVGILFRLGEPRPWWTLTMMSTLLTFLLYLVFGILLNVYLPRSFLGI